MRGEGVRKDESEAASWFLKAANNGSLSAQARMGHHYKEGIGVSIDSYEAIKWYRKAASSGLAEAQVYLGYCYEEGLLGLPKDNLEALRWYRKAADQGDTEGLERLATCYSLGRGVTQSIVEAYAYYTIAMNMTAETERKSALKEHRTLAMAGMGMLSSRASIIRAGQKRAREIEAEIATKQAGK
jgi:TPR repeat protein